MFTQRVYGHPVDPRERGAARRVSRIDYDVGEKISSSKKQIVWKFHFGDGPVEHQLSLTHSLLKAKKVTIER